MRVYGVLHEEARTTARVSSSPERRADGGAEAASEVSGSEASAEETRAPERAFFQTRVMRLTNPNDELGGVLFLATPQVVSHRIDLWSPMYPPAARKTTTDDLHDGSAYHFPGLVFREADREVAISDEQGGDYEASLAREAGRSALEEASASSQPASGSRRGSAPGDPQRPPFHRSLSAGVATDRVGSDRRAATDACQAMSVLERVSSAGSSAGGGANGGAEGGAVGGANGGTKGGLARANTADLPSGVAEGASRAAAFARANTAELPSERCSCASCSSSMYDDGSCRSGRNSVGYATASDRHSAAGSVATATTTRAPIPQSRSHDASDHSFHQDLRRERRRSHDDESSTSWRRITVPRTGPSATSLELLEMRRELQEHLRSSELEVVVIVEGIDPYSSNTFQVPPLPRPRARARRLTASLVLSHLAPEPAADLSPPARPCRRGTRTQATTSSSTSRSSPA